MCGDPQRCKAVLAFSIRIRAVLDECLDDLRVLGVLGGDIASNIDKTYELVQEKLEAFRQQMSGESSSEEPIQPDKSI